MGAVVLSVVGVFRGGWVQGGTATCEAEAQGVKALVPLCLDQALKQAAQSHKRPDLLLKSGWATPPGATVADKALAGACLPELGLAP